MTADNLNVMQASRSDGPRCNDFYNRIYSRSRSLAGWNWEFASEQLEDGQLAFAFIESSEGVVATQAYLPIDLIDRDGSFRSGKSEETLVDPAMRGKGLFDSVYKKLFDISREQEISGLWGFSPATKAFERLGFDLPGKIGQLVLPLKVSFVEEVLESQTESTGKTSRIKKWSAGAAAKVVSAACKRKLSSDPVLRISALREAPHWADGLSQKFIQQWGGLTIHRSSKYLDWRFFSNPYCQCSVYQIDAELNPIGYFVTAKAGDVLFLVDFILVSDSNQDALLTAAVDTVLGYVQNLAVDSGSTGVRAWHGSGHKFSEFVLRRAKRAGWLHVKQGHTVVLWKNPVQEQSNRLSESLDDWYITRAFTEGHQG